MTRTTLITAPQNAAHHQRLQNRMKKGSHGGLLSSQSVSKLNQELSGHKNSSGGSTTSGGADSK